MPNWQWAAPTKPEAPLAFASNMWGDGCACAYAREVGAVIWFSTATAVPLPTRAHPLYPALTVQLHALLGASALHPLPWGQRLLPGSRPPSMEGSCGAGPPPQAAGPGWRTGGWEHPSGSTARRSTLARPPCRGSVISCCVAADLRAKVLRGPWGRLPASSRFLPWLRDREGRPRALTCPSPLA